MSEEVKSIASSKLPAVNPQKGKGVGQAAATRVRILQKKPAASPATAAVGGTKRVKARKPEKSDEVDTIVLPVRMVQRRDKATSVLYSQYIMDANENYVASLSSMERSKFVELMAKLKQMLQDLDITTVTAARQWIQAS